MKKTHSKAWQMAKKISRRKHTLWTPVMLNTDGSVTVASLIRGNTWTMTEIELAARV